MKAASTDDRFQDDKKGGPIFTEGALSSWSSSQEDGARGPHLPGKMGPGAQSKEGPQNFMTPGIARISGHAFTMSRINCIIKSNNITVTSAASIALMHVLTHVHVLKRPLDSINLKRKV